MSLRRAALCAAALLSAAPLIARESLSQPAPAASAAGATRDRVVMGRVRRPMGERGDSTGMGPARDVWVTLHRVGKDTSGAIDSVRANADGGYRLRYTAFGDANALYFASVTYGGIAYFTSPLKADTVAGDDAEITVFDTTSTRFDLSVKGRHLIVGARDTGNVRTVIEVFELSNDSLQTLVATSTRTPTWSTRIPLAATDVRVNEGDVSPAAFSAADGAVAIFAPIAPGVKQLSFTYKLHERDFPLAITADGGAVVFEVLLEDPNATLQALGFTKVADVTLEGRRFSRFLSQDMKPGTRLAVDVPSRGAPSPGALRRYGVLVAAGFIVLLLVGRRMQRNASRHAGTKVPTLRPDVPDTLSAERLQEEIAALDATWARQEQPSDAVRRAYESRRRELESALAQALAEAGSGR